MRQKKHPAESPATGREKSQLPSPSALSIRTCNLGIHLPILGKQCQSFYTFCEEQIDTWSTQYPLWLYLGYYSLKIHKFWITRAEHITQVLKHHLPLNFCLGIQQWGLIGVLNWVATPTCYIWTTDVPSRQRLRWTMHTPLLKIQADGLQLLT